MAVLTHLETDTGTNVDISGATAVGAYTANGDKLIMVDVSIDAVAGNGDYVMYVTRQIGGSGSAYRILPQTTMAAASGLTAISGQSGWITVRNGDVLTCYVDGLAGDTSTPDWSTRWFEASVSLVTLADDAITADKFDESTAYPLKSADTGSTQVARVGADSDTLETLSDEIAAVKAETALIVADTGTDGVKLANTQGAITWGQQKIVANAANEGALDIYNSNISGGIGLYNHSAHTGQKNLGGAVGSGLHNSSPNIGQYNVGNNESVHGYDPDLALEATLTAIKGAGWTNETLVAIDVLIDSIIQHLLDIKGDDGWTGQCLESISTDIYNVDTAVNAIKAKTDNLPATPAQAGEYTAAIAAIPTTGLTAQQVWEYVTRELTSSSGGGATAQEVWEYATRVLTAGTNIDLSALATASALATTDGKVDSILEDTGTTLDTLIKDIPTNAELATALGTADDAVLAAVAAAKVVIDDIHDTDLPAVKSETAAILEDTGTTLPATLGTLATTAHVQEVEDKVDTADAVADAIKVKTDLIPASPAEAGEYTAALTTIDNEIAVIDGIVDDILVDTGTTIPATLATLATAAALDTVDNYIDTEVAAILAAVDTEVAAIKAKTDNLPASPAAVGSAMTLTAAYDKAKDDVLTPLAVVDGIVDAIKVQTDKIPATPASAGEYTANIGAIKAKTDNLPLSPASSGEYTSALTAIQNDLDNPNQYKADVSGLATQASVNAIPTTPLLAANYTAPDNATIGTIAGNVDDLETRLTAARAGYLDKLNVSGTLAHSNDAATYKADVSGLATSTEVGAIALLGETVIGSYTVQDILKILAAKMVGKATGGSTATITYRGVDDTSDVIIETVDSNGNRSAVTLTV